MSFFYQNEFLATNVFLGQNESLGQNVFLSQNVFWVKMCKVGPLTWSIMTAGP